jgi:hypothetical protein
MDDEDKDKSFKEKISEEISQEVDRFYYRGTPGAYDTENIIKKPEIILGGDEDTEGDQAA